MRCDVFVGFYGMLCSFVTTLQDDNSESTDHLTKSTPPKRRFWEEEQKTKPFKVVSTPFGQLTIAKSTENRHCIFSRFIPKSSFGEHKLCKMEQKIVATCERCVGFPGMHATIFCSNFMLPKRRFWTVEQSVTCAFLKYFSRV